VLDNRGTCAHSGFCTDRIPTVFRAGTEPFVAPSGGRMDEIVCAVRACPSGALSFAVDGREAREQVDQDRGPVVEVSRDGPYRVTGGISLLDDAGAPVARNAGASLEYYSLCRCGHSQNKPFCSGMHYYVNFADPPMPEQPTLFEWAGGFPALLRMTRLFYGRYVSDDPLLAPLARSSVPAGYSSWCAPRTRPAYQPTRSFVPRSRPTWSGARASRWRTPRQGRSHRSTCRCPVATGWSGRVREAEYPH
jgi:CDGSH-type Zn-finger protein/uncharacterized Fe-S cluster protein YjdI